MTVCSGTTTAGRHGGRGWRRRALTASAATVVAVAVAAGAAPAASAAPVEGAAMAWGRGDVGQMGSGMVGGRATPGPIPGALESRVIQVAAGNFHAVALRSNGRAWTWGSGSSGQLGNGTTPSRQLAPAQVNGVSDIVQVAVGVNDTFAVRSDGTVWAWGANDEGQLGDGTANNTRLTPVQVSGLTGVIQVGAGLGFAVAVRNDGTVWTWGDNRIGELGDGTGADHITPRQVPGLAGVTSVAAGESNVLAVSGGSVFSWGPNNVGQLGIGTPSPPRLAPVQVPGLTAVTSVAFGSGHGLAVSGGDVFAWGAGSRGQLGDGTASDRYSPFRVAGLTGISSVAAGPFHSMAVTSDHRVLGWGFNITSEVGDGTHTLRPIPVQIPGLTTVEQISGGNGFTLAIVT